MTETPPEDVDQDSGPPAGAPAPDPGGEAVSPASESGSDRVEHPADTDDEADGDASGA